MESLTKMDFSTKVGVKLLVEGVENGESKNMLTSPLSYNVVINMIAAGSSGQTRDQILQFLERSNIEEVNSESSKLARLTAQESDTSVEKLMNKDVAPSISFLNIVSVDQEYVLKDCFQELVENLFKAKVTSFDCLKPKTVVEEINEWASASTKGLIKEVVQEQLITPTTVLILGNSLHFKGAWADPFQESLTKDLWFYLLNGEKIKAPFMTGSIVYSHRNFQDFQVVRIPYKTGGDVSRKFALYIFLPNENEGLKDLLKKVNSDPEFFKKHCDSSGSIVRRFYIPKFKFNYLSESGPDIMKSKGLTLPFDKEMAEFYEMIANGKEVFGDERLHVTNIVQSGCIEVDERGTQAAVVTFPLLRGGAHTTGEFIADHPFMFVIREDNTGLLFFLGTVLNPLEA